MRISIAKVEELRRKLDELPPQDTLKLEVSKQEAVALLSEQVKALQGRGYMIGEIAGLLTAGGLPVSVATLKSYLTRARTTSRKARGNPQRTAASAREPRKVEPKESTSGNKRSGEAVAPADARKRIESNPGVGSGGFRPREDSIDI